jgi:Ca-activated chloride channel family protein
MGGPAGGTMMTPRPSVAARLLLLFVVLACFGGALYLVFRKGQTSGGPGGSPQAEQPSQPAGGPRRVALGVAYGTEKRTWLEAAAREFMNTPQGRDIDVRLTGMGSLEAAQKVWEGKDRSVHVWSPASEIYTDVFVTEWRAKHGADPILHRERLALTPMVFVMREDRYQPFAKKYGGVTFKAIAQALGEETGWRAIADQPDWGFFRFSHTHPNKSNSGLMTLFLMAHDYFDKPSHLGGAELTRADFQKYLRTIESNAASQMGQLVDSTGNLMVDMVRFGPSRYDCVFVYESTAIDQLRQAEGRWGKLRVVYPKYNMWSDNPYYVLDVPWSGPEHREAARKFLAYLLSEPVQQRALDHGFRPANVAVPTNGPNSPLVQFRANGLRTDLPGRECAAPRAEVINGLLHRWQQIR